MRCRKLTRLNNITYVFLAHDDIVQSVLNTAVRLVAGSSRRDHVTSLLRDRHWLPVKQRVEYKLCMIMDSYIIAPGVADQR